MKINKRKRLSLKKQKQALFIRDPGRVYTLKARYSEKFNHHLILENVPGRSLILIHPANDAKTELLGCIAPVTFLSGIGKGTVSKPLLQKLVSLCYQAFNRCWNCGHCCESGCGVGW